MSSRIDRQIEMRNRQVLASAVIVVGGLLAAPFAALLTRRLRTKTLLALVGSVIVLISAFNLYRALA